MKIIEITHCDGGTDATVRPRPTDAEAAPPALRARRHVGVRGRFALSGDRAWYVPYCPDLGTGGSKLTWQALGGVGYAFDWGDVTVSWRYLACELKSGNPIRDMNMSGPNIAFVYCC